MTNSYHIFAKAEQRERLLTTLRAMGVARIECDFAGSGDSGNFEEPIAFGIDNERIDITSISLLWSRQVQQYEYSLQGMVSNTKVETTPQFVPDIIKDMCNFALDKEGIDWYNNDGGQGTFSIDFSQSPPEIKLEVGINVTSTEDYEYDFTDDTGADACTPATTP